MKKRGSALVVLAAGHELNGPRLGVGVQVHGRDHIEQHPRREPVRDDLDRDVRDRLDEAEELTVAVPDRSADVRVVAGRVSLELPEQPRAVGDDEISVGATHGTKRLLAPQTAAGGPEDLEGLRHAALDGGDVQRLLGAEEAEEVRLRNACRGRDLVGRRAVQPPVGECRGGCLEHRLAALLGCLALGSRRHHGSEYSLPSTVCQASFASASATRSSSASVRLVWNGSASARSNASSAPGNGPWSRYAVSRWSAYVPICASIPVARRDASTSSRRSTRTT